MERAQPAEPPVGHRAGQLRALKFEVADTGPGLAPAELALIFEPFQQVGAGERQAEGTGLGLAISRSLARLMGTELRVTSQAGQGSRFWFTLPLFEILEEAARPAAARRRPVGIKDGRPRLLVVDDLAENRALLVELLGPLGFELAQAGGGAEAVAKAVEFQPQAVLLDLIMPEMDGYALARRLRQSLALQNPVIIAVSASAFGEDRQKALEAGCDDFLPKPIDIRLLLEKLGQQLGLEWLYEADEAGQSEAGEAEVEPGRLLRPPGPELAVLRELATIGDIGGILEEVERLEAVDGQFRPFTAHVRRLAARYDVAAIRAFVGERGGEGDEGDEGNKGNKGNKGGFPHFL
jgi:CheY-like chemotaxis protein